MGFGRHKTSGEEETRQEATRISRFWKNKNEKTGAKTFHSPNKDVLAVGDCYSWEIKRKRKLLQWLSLPGGRLAELEQTEEVKSARINRKYGTLIILTSRHNVEIVWNYINKLFACKLAKPQWLQRNSIYPNRPSGQQTGSSPFQCFWQHLHLLEREQTIKYSGKGFLGLSGAGYQRKGSCWQLTELQHVFLKPGWILSHYLLTKRAGSGSLLLWSYARKTWNCRVRRDWFLPVEADVVTREALRRNMTSPSYLIYSFILILPWIENYYP